MKYIISKIKWDTSDWDEEEELASGVCVPDLPSSVEIDTDDMEWDLEDPNDTEEVADWVADWLSDEYGYCHYGFQIKKAKKKS